MQAQPATSGLKDAPKRHKRRYLHGLAGRVTAAPTSALSNEPSLGPRGAACEAAPNAALRTAACGTGRALGLQVQLGGKGVSVVPVALAVVQAVVLVVHRLFI